MCKIEIIQTEHSKYQFAQLNWSDFKANPNLESNFHAYAYWKIAYSYKSILKGSKVTVNLKAQCIFEKERSWVKEEHKSQSLLEHEQGHYIIGWLCALTFKNKVEK